MRKLLIILTILFSITLAGCWSKISSNKNCHEPENPYNEWWHYAWFEWARDTWWYCDWNSQSFNNWCKEYYNQLNTYQKCLE